MVGIFFFHSANCQCSFEREFICVNYNDNEPDIKKSHYAYVNFNDGFNKDSITVTANGKVVFTGNLTTERSTGYAGSFRIRKSKKGVTVLKLQLHNQKSFCEIVYDTRYSLLMLYHMSGTDIETHWVGNFRNTKVLYE
jgi:hypothetical protein